MLCFIVPKIELKKINAASDDCTTVKRECPINRRDLRLIAISFNSNEK